MPHSPPWNLPFFTVEFILSFPCFHYDHPLSCQGVALAHLDSLPPHNLVICTDDSVSLSFVKGACGIHANCSLCGTEATLFFSAGPVCSSFSAKASTILQLLHWSRQHQQVCHFFPTLALSFSPYLLLSQSFRQILQKLSSLSSCTIRLQCLRTFISHGGMTWLMIWPDSEHCFCSLQSLVVSDLSYPLFSYCGSEACCLI